MVCSMLKGVVWDWRASWKIPASKLITHASHDNHSSLVQNLISITKLVNSLYWKVYKMSIINQKASNKIIRNEDTCRSSLSRAPRWGWRSSLFWADSSVFTTGGAWLLVSIDICGTSLKLKRRQFMRGSCTKAWIQEEEIIHYLFLNKQHNTMKS